MSEQGIHAAVDSAIHLIASVNSKRDISSIHLKAREINGKEICRP